MADLKDEDEQFGILNKDFDYYCEVTVYGYCRSKLDSDFATVDVPVDIIQLVLFWYHPNTISLQCITLTKIERIMINPRDTVQDLKAAIEYQMEIPQEQQRLFITSIGKPLIKDHLTISDYNLHTNDCITLQVRLRQNAAAPPTAPPTAAATVASNPPTT